MKEQKIFYLDVFQSNGYPTESSQKKLKNEWDDGWRIATTTPQAISSSGGVCSGVCYGGFLLILEK